MPHTRLHARLHPIPPRISPHLPVSHSNPRYLTPPLGISSPTRYLIPLYRIPPLGSHPLLYLRSAPCRFSKSSPRRGERSRAS